MGKRHQLWIQSKIAEPAPLLIKEAGCACLRQAERPQDHVRETAPTSEMSVSGQTA